MPEARNEQLSVKEAAAALGISVQGVHKRIDQGLLDARKVNKHWQVERSSVEYALLTGVALGRPRTGTEYILMNGQYPVMEFTYRSQTKTFRPGEVFDAARAPIGTVSRNGRGKAKELLEWWQHRSIPMGRQGLDAKLAELGVDEPWRIPFSSLGLSLTDQYWIRPQGQELAWEDVNFFDNDFSTGDQGGRCI